MLQLLGPALKEGKTLEWVAERFGKGSGSKVGYQGEPKLECYIESKQACKLLRKLVVENNNDTCPMLWPKWLSEQRRRVHGPEIRQLPEISYPTFYNWLSHLATPRNKHPTIAFEKGDKQWRLAYCTNTYAHPLIKNSEERLLNEIQRSVGVDEYGYNHAEAVKKYVTGRVSRAGVVTPCNRFPNHKVKEKMHESF